MADSQDLLLCFGPFTVDRLGRCLFRDGVRIPLQEQPFQILLALTEMPGHVVTRESLRQRLWGDATFVDFDQSLNSAIRRLRVALLDSPRQPTYIETVPRLGFRFRAEVTIADRTPKPTATPTPEPIIEPELPPILEHVSPIGPALLVAPAPSIAAASPNRWHLPAFAGALAAAVLVLGVFAETPARSWQWAHPAIRLPSPTDSQPVSSIPPLSAPFALEQAIPLTSSESPADEGQLAAPDHHLTELTGWYHLSLRSEIGYGIAERSFEQVLAADPHCPTALVGHAEAQILLALNGDATVDRLAVARMDANRALHLAPQLPEAHAVLGAVRALELWDAPAAEQEFHLALALDPHSSLAHLWFAMFVLVPERRYAEAEQEANNALRADPLSLIAHTNLGWIFLNQGKRAAALEQYRFVLNINPAFIPARFRMAQLLRAEGKPEAARAFDPSDPPGPADSISLRRSTYTELHAGGAPTLADPCTLTERSGNSGPKDPLSTLRTAVDHRCPAYFFFGQDPAFLPLRTNPEFAALQRTAFLPHR